MSELAVPTVCKSYKINNILQSSQRLLGGVLQPTLADGLFEGVRQRNVQYAPVYNLQQ